MFKLNENTIKLWGLLFVVFLLGGYVFYKIDAVIAPFIISIVGAYAFHVPMEKMQKMGIPRFLGAFFLIVCIFSFLILFITWAVPFVKDELSLFIQAYPEIQKKILTFVNPYIQNISKLTGAFSPQDFKLQLSDSFGQIIKWGVGLIIALLTNGFAIANIISLVVLTPIIMFYFLKDWPKILIKLDQLLPYKYAEQLRNHFSLINNTLASYAKGQLLVCLSLMLGYSILLTIIGLPQSLFIGLLTGFLAFIPYLGVIVGFLLSITVAFTHFSDFSQVLNVVCIFGFLSALEGYFLTPKFIGDRIGLHPVLIIFSLLALGSWFGLLGIVFAFPIAAILAVLFRSFITWYKNKFV